MFGFVRESTFRYQKEMLSGCLKKWNKTQQRLERVRQFVVFQNQIINEQDATITRHYNTIIELMKDKDRINENNLCLWSENESLERKIEDLEYKNAELRDEIADLYGEVDEQAEIADDFCKTVCELEKKNSELQEEIDRLMKVR